MIKQIAIDGNEANVERQAGIGRFAFNVLRGIHKLAQKDMDRLTFRIFLKNSPLSGLPEKRPGWDYKVIGPRVLWSQVALPLYFYSAKTKPDILYSTSHYTPRFSRVSSVVSVMDLSYLHYPHLFKRSDLYKLKNWTAFSVRNAAKIITISNFSKSEIMKYYGIEGEKITVAYPGIDHSLFNPGKKSRGNYVLYVGTLQPRKNISGLIKAFEKIPAVNGLKLVIVGKKGWMFDGILKNVHDSKARDRIVFKEFVPDRELVDLYRKAVCFVLPSFYEGFGIPAVEAMACGCPVIVSNTSSLPEIVGQAGIMVNPQDSDEIAGAILKISKNAGLRSRMSEDGKVRAKSFTWEKTAKIIYTTLLKTLEI